MGSNHLKITTKNMDVIIFNNIEDFNDCNNRIKAALEITLKTGMDNYTDQIDNNVTGERALHYSTNSLVRVIIDSVLKPEEVVTIISKDDDCWFPNIGDIIS